MYKLKTLQDTLDQLGRFQREIARVQDGLLAIKRIDDFIPMSIQDTVVLYDKVAQLEFHIESLLKKK